MLGVSFTSTGVRATSLTHSVIMQAYSGTWPTAEPMPRSLMPWGQPKLSSRPSAPASSERLTMSCQASRFESTIRDAITAWCGIALLDFGDLAQVGVDGAVADELDVVEAHHALAVPIDRGVARGDVDDGVADGLPHGAAPAGIEGAHHLLAAVGGRAGGQPEGIGAANAGEIGGEVSHGCTIQRHARRRVCRRPRRPPLRGRR